MAGRVLRVNNQNQEGTDTSVAATEEAPKPALWVFVDTETTGLLRDSWRGQRVMVLEAAWMVVDAATLEQLSPLRQRTTAIWERPNWWDRLRAWSRLRSLSPSWTWDVIPMHPSAREMHEKTGLHLAWELSGPIRDVAELDKLIRADIETARTRVGDPDARVHLAGPGVAQFEARLLPRVGSAVTSWCHYRCADTSVASMVAGVPKVEQVSWDGVDSVDLQTGIASCQVEHRAAGDVLRSYALARRLREVGREIAGIQ